MGKKNVLSECVISISLSVNSGAVRKRIRASTYKMTASILAEK